MRRIFAIQILAALAILMASLVMALAEATGNLKLDVMGDLGAGAVNQAEVIASNGKTIAKVAPGATVALPPGIYKLKLPIIGGAINKDDVAIVAGRTHTVLIENVAVLGVSVKDKDGKDPGFGVTVTETDPPHRKVADFISGEKILFAPSMVDVKVDAPPQGYDWHAVTLIPGNRKQLTLNEVQDAELVIQTVLSKSAMDQSTRVIVYRAGTQKQVAVSEPAPEHRIKLEPGDYDIFVENNSGKGLPTATIGGIHVDGGAKVNREVPLDEKK
ncbi:MAG TPA: hypothetical protein VN867_10040 [Candidatus Binataceae bacterium]|nr:hypothetical protein [Candidatus Binataceae bacterium]